MDTRTAEQRSAIMKSVHSKNTLPEIQVRRLLHRMGFRFRIHVRDLPGTPDIAIRKSKKAIFVHGCFWHGHECPKGRLPKSNEKYWHAKIEANRQRDSRNLRDLKSLGFDVAVVWTCELKSEYVIAQRLVNFLGTPKKSDRL